jgi:crotonobetainyl-CoA:carnitine CoA-transferase CaiB-like acyl-CoA transferase
VFEGVRVLDLTDESGFLAGKILGDMGADVIKLEPPEGDPARRRGPFLGTGSDPERSLPWLALNTSKRGITIDLDTDEGRSFFLQLIPNADVVLESGRPGALRQRGLGWESLRSRNPRLVYCAISPFGQTGPYSSYRGHDLVIVAMGGNASLTGHPDRAPVRCSMPTAYYHAGPEAALGVAMALYAREDTGRGQFVDVSLHETQLQTLLSSAGQYALTRKLGHRDGARVGGMREIWAARDGYVSFGLRGGPARIPNLKATVDYMKECSSAPKWLLEYDWSSYNHNTLDPGELARLEAAFGAFFASKTMRELYEQALERRILLAPCNDAREIAEQPQLRDRGLFTSIDYPELGATLEHPGFFAVGHGIRIRSRAPRIGEHNAELSSEANCALQESGTSASQQTPQTAKKPNPRAFEGVKFLELGSGAAGPVATRYFVEHGASVIRIESSIRPDFLRILWLTPDSPHGLDGSPMFILLNPGKQSVSVNMKTTEGIGLVRRLLKWADVISENFAPGPMAKWGLDYEAVRSVSPEIVMMSACLFGQTGPQRGYPGFGGQGSAISGFNHLTGWPDREAHGPSHTITDSLSPRYVALAIAGALFERRHTGKGQYIDLSQIEAAVYSQSELMVRHSANGEVVGRTGNEHAWAAPHAVYPCRGEDRWIAIAVFSNAEWSALRHAMGDPEWANDARFGSESGRLAAHDELDLKIAAWTSTFDCHALMRMLQESGVEAGAVQNNADLLDDPQLAHRGHFVGVRHVHLGELLCERSGFRLSESEGSYSQAGPNLGEHTETVLREILGMSSEEIARLTEDGITV